ncbi:MAG: hypothetical protein JWQ96_3177 [Segetibacter sp.]|nr:hypothetical protein [Segetibacter sp.]
MRRILFTLLLASLTPPLLCQYYLRGEVKDERGRLLPNVKIKLFSKGDYPFYTGSAGTFGIPSSLKIDTVCFSSEGYEPLKTPINTSQFASFTLKMTAGSLHNARSKLSSFTKDLFESKSPFASINGESYSATIENHFINASNFPETGFALNVDRASYSNVRRFLNQKSKPPSYAVRIEEMLNYFNLNCTNNFSTGEVIKIKTNITSCPWNPSNQLLFINLKANKINLENTPATNFVFLIDVSGSMDMPNRLPLLQNGFKLLVENLREKDTVSIVTYGGGVAVMLSPTSGSSKKKIVEAIEGLSPSGSTPGETAIRAAYRLAKNSFIKGGNNRVILATDGDFNVGQTSEKELEDLIFEQSKSGIYLTCLGVGMGNYKDSKLEALARKGNGNFAYMDNEREAEKIMVEEFAQTMYTVANNVYLNVEFNNEMVKEYRLIGFDNKTEALMDTSSILEGGEIGSGHSLLSIFEITPTEKNLKSIQIGTLQSVASLNLNYRIPGSDEVIQDLYLSTLNYTPLEKAEPSLRFAAAVTMFGGMLKQSDFLKNVDWSDITEIAATSIEPGNLVQKEFLGLVESAKKLYLHKKKKKST